MNILAFDTCFDACSATLVCSSGDLAACRFEPMVTGHAERLVPMIGEVVEEAGLAFEEIDLIAVSRGPGTFTGTRICVAAARSLALALEKPVVAATSLAVMAEEIAEALTSQGEAPDRDILIATDARREEVYCQLFRAGAAITEPAVLLPHEAARLPQDGTSAVVAGSGGPAVAAAAVELGRPLHAVRPDLLPSALFLAKLALRLPPTKAAVSPLYLRPADAKPQAGTSIPRATS